VREAVRGAGIDMLEKPYSPTTLVQRVHEALTAELR
jgi:FixJ family two-component response regulator